MPGSSAAGRVPGAGTRARVSAVEISVSFWEIGHCSGTGETAPVDSETRFRQPGSPAKAWCSGRPDLTVVVFLDWTVIVCEVGGADKVCENKIPIVGSSALVCLSYGEKIKV